MARFGNGPLSSESVSRLVQRGDTVALFQPIEALQTGVCRGVEALARLPHQKRLLAPDAFLPLLGPDDRLCLFGTMLGHSLAFLRAQRRAGRDLYVSLNVEISLLVSDDFVDVLHYFLERYDFSGERLVLEILENEEVTDLAALHQQLDAIRALGLSMALDDIGSGFASLQKVKQLPIDVFKLDRIFCRNLESKPEDLVFIMSILLLAQGLGKAMVVEGIESPEVYDALRMLGVKYGQGYAIAPPLDAERFETWIIDRSVRLPDRVPRCLLGAYASHLTVVESCRALGRQPLPMAWTSAATDHHGCAVGQLLGRRGWHGTAFGDAHAAFHRALPAFDTDPETYRAAVARFQATMAAAILADPGDFRCEVVGEAARGVPRAGASAPRPRKIRRAAG